MYKHNNHFYPGKNKKATAMMTQHNKIIINNDPNNLSHLSREDQIQIQIYERQIEELKLKKPNATLTAYQLFENKNFNMFKNKYPHQEVYSLYDLIKSKWHNELTEE